MTFTSTDARNLARIADAVERSAAAHERDAAAREAMAEMMRLDHEQLAEANRQAAVLAGNLTNRPRTPGQA